MSTSLIADTVINDATERWLDRIKEIVARIQAHYGEKGYKDALKDFIRVYDLVRVCSFEPAELGFTNLEQLIKRAYDQYGDHLASLKLLHQLQVEEVARIKALETTAYIAEFLVVATAFLETAQAVACATKEMLEFKAYSEPMFPGVLK